MRKTAPPVDWCELFADFFRARRARLLRIYRAAQVREHWLQAEAFDYFRQRGHDLWVNELLIGPQMKCDFSGYLDDEPTMAAELKVYGVEGYQNKNLAGYSDLARFVRADGDVLFQDVPRDRAMVHPTVSSVLKDFFRLRDFWKKHRGVTPLLLLVVDTRGRADEFGSVITRVQFGTAGRTLLDGGGLLVRAWDVSD